MKTPGCSFPRGERQMESSMNQKLKMEYDLVFKTQSEVKEKARRRFISTRQSIFAKKTHENMHALQKFKDTH